MEETATPPREPFRKRLGKQVRLPRLSGKVSAACLVVCFALTAVLLPAVLRLQPWVEFEIVLAVWWLIWLAVLARLLYTHQFVQDDHAMRSPRKWFSLGKGSSSEGGGTYFFDGLGTWGGDDGEAVAVGCGIVIGLILLFFALWLLIEIAIPLVLFLLYFVLRGMLARVVNDRHGCQGHFGKSLGWAAVWATAYTAPLAVVVWVIHAVQKPPL